MEWARLNEELLWYLYNNRTESTEWMVAAAFYSAVHLLSAYLVTKKKAAVGPHSGDRFLVEDPVLDTIALAYGKLKDYQFGILYRLRTHTLQQISADVVPQLEAIKKHIFTNLQ